MTNNTKAKIMLQYETIEKYVGTLLKKNGYEVSSLIESSSRADAYNNYSSAQIGEEWDEESAERFIEDGYSKDDIIYDSWDDAIYDAKEEIVYKEVDYIIKEYFDNDKDFLKPTMDYLFG